MAVYINNNNVFSQCFAINEEINVLLTFISPRKSDELYKIICPSSKTTENSSGNKSKQNQQHQVVSVAVSNDGKFLAVSDSENSLHLLKLGEGSFNHIFTRSLVRKSQKIIFTHNGSEVIVADRGGDVYSFSVRDKDEKSKFLLGHISLIIDVCMTPDDKFLLTSDRDGKVRISHYPNCYNIHSYCLGHQEFVSSVLCIELDKISILSSSGDGSLILWDMMGNELCRENLFENKEVAEAADNQSSTCESDNVESSISLPHVIDEKQVMFAVKYVRYSLVSELCVVLFYSIKGICVYNLDAKSNNPCFKFVQFISLPNNPLDLYFDCDGNLVVIMVGIESKLMHFKVNNDGKFSLISENSSPNFSDNFQELFKDISKLSPSHSDYDTLFKRQFEYDEKEKCVDKLESTKKIKCC